MGLLPRLAPRSIKTAMGRNNYIPSKDNHFLFNYEWPLMRVLYVVLYVPLATVSGPVSLMTVGSNIPTGVS